MKAGQEEWSLNVSLKKSKQSTYVYKLKVDLCTEKDTTYLQGFIFIANQCSSARGSTQRHQWKSWKPSTVALQKYK